MVNAKREEPVWLDASIAWIVKLELPCVVGVPLITPVDGFSERTVGGEPDVTENVYGDVPPATHKVTLYTVPTIPSGKAGEDTATFAPPPPPPKLSREM